MKVVFFGNSSIALVSLRAMVEVGYDVIGIVTQEKKMFLSCDIKMLPVKEFALSKHIAILSSQTSLSNKMKQLEAWNADLFVVFEHEQILTKEMLRLPVYGCINIHPSLLPKYRGKNSIQCAICNGDKKTGITIIKMNEKMDAGDIITQKSILIADEETTKTLKNKIGIIGAGLLLETLPMLEFNIFISCRQNEKKATYTKQHPKIWMWFSKMKQKLFNILHWDLQRVQFLKSKGKKHAISH